MQRELTCRHFIKTTAHGINQSHTMKKENRVAQRPKTIEL